ncbi:MAG: hypothetical protein AAGE52_39765 [Myxococcota bacterium]
MSEWQTKQRAIRRRDVVRRWVGARLVSVDSARLLRAVVDGERGDALANRLEVTPDQLATLEIEFAKEAQQGVYMLGRHLAAEARLV